MSGASASVRAAMQAIVGVEHVSSEGLDRYRVGRMIPSAAARPATEEEVSRLLALASAERLAVVPWGRGRLQSLGRAPSRYDLALDLSRLDRVLAHEPEDLTATVQAGITLGALNRRLAASGQFLPLDPPFQEDAALGGVLATGVSGPWRTRYGTGRDLTLGVRIVQADGTVTKAGARVVKNATAYDLTKLYLGSHGTLGVLTEATLRLFPRPDAAQGWWVAARGLEAAQSLADRVLGSHLAPDRVELVDAHAAAACGVQPAAPGVLLSFAGVQEALLEEAALLRKLAGESGSTVTPLAGAAAWSAVREYPWGMDEAQPTALWRASVLPADVAKAMRAAAEAGGGAVRCSSAATVAVGVLRGRVTARDVAGLEPAIVALRQAVEALGGFVVLLDAPQAVRERQDVWGEPRGAIQVMERLKQAFDPLRILNPGRFVGGI